MANISLFDNCGFENSFSNLIQIQDFNETQFFINQSEFYTFVKPSQTFKSNHTQNEQRELKDSPEKKTDSYIEIATDSSEAEIDKEKTRNLSNKKKLVLILSTPKNEKPPDYGRSKLHLAISTKHIKNNSIVNNEKLPNHSRNKSFFNFY